MVSIGYQYTTVDLATSIRVLCTPSS